MSMFSELLLLLVPLLSQCVATKYFIRPTESNISCPGEPCFTHNQYTSDSDYSVHSNAIFKFLPGTHHMDRPLVIKDVKNITIEGSQNSHDWSVILEPHFSCAGYRYQDYCKQAETSGSRTYTHCAVVQLVNVSDITLAGLDLISVQGQTSDAKIGILVSKADDLVINSLAVKNFYYGIAVCNASESSLTNILISGSTSDGFVLSQAYNIFLTNTTSNSNGGNGLIISSSRGIKMINSDMHSNVLNGVSILSVTDSSFIQMTTLNNTENGVYMMASNFTLLDKLFLLYNKQYGIKLSNVYYVHLANIISNRNEDSGVYLTTTVGTCIANVSSHRNKWSGIEISRSTNTTLLNILCSHNEWIGTSLLESNFTTITNASSLYNEWTGIKVCSSNNTTIRHVLSKENTVHGVGIESSYETKLVKVFVKHNNYDGVSIYNSYNTCLSSVYSAHNVGFGISIYMSFSTTAKDINATNNSNSGVELLESSATILWNIVSDYNSEEGIYVNSCSNTTIKCVSAKNNSKSGLQLTSCNRMLILDVVTTGNKWYGLYIENSNFTQMKNFSLVYNVGGSLQFWQTRNSEIEYVSVFEDQGEGIALVETFDTFISNASSSVTAYRSFNIVIANSLFSYNNVSLSTSTAEPSSLPAVVVLYESTLSIENCTFTRNMISSIKVFGSNVTVLGDMKIYNNTALAGVGFIFVKNSTLILTENSHMVFRNNHAINNGGVFHISTEQSYTLGQSLDDLVEVIASKSIVFPAGHVVPQNPCFLHVEGQRLWKRMIFENNTSGNGGDVIYGGELALGWDGINWNCLLSFKNISDMSQQKMYSPISSTPSRVCLCNTRGEPECLITEDPNKRSIYPGQTITISAVVVGQDFGIVAGSVYAQFLNSTTSISSLESGKTGLAPSGCATFEYTVFDSSISNKVLVLTAQKMKVTNVLSLQNHHNLIDSLAYVQSLGTEADIADINNLLDSNATKALIKFTNDGQVVFPKELYELPVYINISLRSCPLAFQLRTNPPFKCDCDPLLMPIEGVECHIQDQTISRGGLVWIGLEQHETVAISAYCPYDYCKRQRNRVSLSNPDLQCTHNHSGTLCGGCQSGLSLILGSNECELCSNNYLLLLLLFTAAGVLLVFLIKSLDLTVVQGTVNGLIFYANMVKAVDYAIFPHKSLTPLTLFISWFNLDLGIKICFFDGLNAYIKTMLQFAFPLYIWSIVCLIIVVAKRSNRMARTMGNNSVPVLATLFLLSYAKLFRAIITSLSFTIVYTSKSSRAVWSADGNVDYLSSKHIPLFIIATATLLLLWLPYTLLLFLEQWLHKFNCHILSHLLIKMKPFLDAHYGSLLDSHRYWFGALLLVKATVLLLSSLLPVDHTTAKVLSIAIASTALLFWGQIVYRNKKTTLFSAFLFANLILLSATNLFVTITRGNVSIASNIFVGVAFFQFLGLILYKMFRKLKKKSGLVSVCQSVFKCSQTKPEDDWDVYEQVTQNRQRRDTESELGSSNEGYGTWNMESLPTYGVS